jgi:hypothetical protein
MVKILFWGKNIQLGLEQLKAIDSVQNGKHTGLSGMTHE